MTHAIWVCSLPHPSRTRSVRRASGLVQTGFPENGPNRSAIVRESHSSSTAPNADDISKHCAVSGELSGRVRLPRLPAPGPKLVAICKGLLPLPI